MPAIATYPGSISPLRGLSPFGESEREVFFGRDSETDTLSRLVTTDGFRAGLLYGEHGVGKTSLLRAGLVPILRDHGIIALLCSNIQRPIESFVSELGAATGMVPGSEERPIDALARAVSSSVGQQFLFVLDDVDLALASGEIVVHGLAELYSRVVTRSGGRARFLFCCASDNVHRLAALEQRTGSLFTPTSRYELRRLAPDNANMVLERTLALGGVGDTQLARAVIDVLGQSGPILPADLQIAVLGILQLRLSSPQELQRMGGAAELERTWLKAGAAATGSEQTALRLLAELAGDPRKLTACTADWLAARASVELAFARHALPVLQDRGIVRAVESENGTEYMLAHTLLLMPVRELAASARETSRRAYQLLGSKVETGKRLSLREYLDMRREGIAPTTPDERAVVARTTRFFLTVLGAVLAAPLLMLVIVYIAMFGHFYLDVDTPQGGGAERVVVRAGRPGLSAFHWLPGPSFGEVVADTGFTRPMVQDSAWKSASANDIGGDLDDYARVALGTLTPSYRYLIEYATSGEARALEELRKRVQGPQDMVALLESIRPVARGSKDEVDLVESALKDPAPSVQRSALRVAASAAQRHEGVYHDTLAQAMTAPDADLRRLALSAAQALGDDTARALYRAALATNPEPAARRELLSMVTAADAVATPSAESAASILVNRDLPQSTRDKARSLLKRAFAADPKAATMAAARLAGDDKAPQEDRVLALDLMRDFAPADIHADIADEVKAILGAGDEVIRAAALPLYANIAPKDAAAELVLMLENKDLGEDLRKASALAWGEVAARTKDRAAATALETFLKDPSDKVRAAAAEAYGNTGRLAQEALIKMVKTERFDVSVGAARGLANSVIVGASPSTGVGGILQLWKRKGKPRREAAEIFVEVARTKSNAVYSYLAAALRANDDPGLHVIGVRGLCNASVAGNRKARRLLVDAATSGSTDVRRVVIECIVDTPTDAKTATDIATLLARSGDAGIRADVARVLASLAGEGKAAKPVTDALGELAQDDERDVRTIAIRALARMGANAPQEASKALLRAYERADEAEKLALLEAARDMGASEIVQQAVSDASPLVRVAALETALATGTNVTVVVNAALTDTDRSVRVAALERLAANKDKLEQDALSKSLSLAVHDPDPTISELALTTLARLGSSEEVTERLARALAQKSEHERVQAASAAIGLVEREPEKAVKLLTPLLDDPSHDVRAAMLPALASAWSATHTPEQLAAILRGSEQHAMRRITATAAFLVLARTDNGREPAKAALAQVAKQGPALARIHAELGIGLIESSASGIEFLQMMAP